MKALRDTSIGRWLNRGLTLTRVRVISQVVFFVLFLLAIWATCVASGTLGTRSKPTAAKATPRSGKASPLAG